MPEILRPQFKVNYYPTEQKASINPLFQRVALNGEPVRYARSFEISRVGPFDKFTKRCECCVGLILAGTYRKDPGIQISQLAHVSPDVLDSGVKEDFTDEFGRNLTAFNLQTVESTRVAGLMGGFVGLGRPERNYTQEYTDLSEFLNGFVLKRTGARLALVRGPKVNKGKTDIYYATQEKTVIIVEAGKNATLYTRLASIGRRLFLPGE